MDLRLFATIFSTCLMTLRAIHYTDHVSTSFVLNPGDRIYSLDGFTYLTYQSSDGNLVLRYKDDTMSNSEVLWASGSTSAAGGDCTVQSDGNIVVRDASGGVDWASGTHENGVGAPYHLVVSHRVCYLLDTNMQVKWSKGDGGNYPTFSPPTGAPTKNPTAIPTQTPIQNPTQSPTAVPTQHPTTVPTKLPTLNPTKAPTFNPTVSPSAPIVYPTAAPSASVHEAEVRDDTTTAPDSETDDESMDTDKAEEFLPSEVMRIVVWTGGGLVLLLLALMIVLLWCYCRSQKRRKKTIERVMEEGYADSHDTCMDTANTENVNILDAPQPGTEMKPNTVPVPSQPGSDPQPELPNSLPSLPPHGGQLAEIACDPYIPQQAYPQQQQQYGVPGQPQGGEEMEHHNPDANGPPQMEQYAILTPRGGEDDNDGASPNDTSDYVLQTPGDVEPIER